MKIVVIGGSGRVGGNVVRRLAAQGHEAVPASPDTGVDTISGEGLADAMAGADVVVDVSNAPVGDDDAAREFFTTSTRNLLRAERDASVSHHVAVSIVGADRLPNSGYLRAKVAQEAAIEIGPIPYTILRSTQFFEFLPQIAEAGADAYGVRLSTGLMQLVAVDDVAATVAELATDSPAGGRVELGGPEALGIDEWARRLFTLTGDERTVVSDPHARYFGTELEGGELTPGNHARIGTIDFDTWYATSRFTSDRGEAAGIAMEEWPMHFEEDIKPLFRERDRDSMLFAFDLWSPDDVSTHADGILARLEAGTMPCDGAWPAERVAILRHWIAVGKPL
jgi:uncharacterized protein YbjT (DUF2867 family)